MKTWHGSIALCLAAALCGPARRAQSHCDTLDGPVITDAKLALQRGDVGPALKWVPESREAELRDLFREVTSGDLCAPDSRAFGERYFFETAVRLHREGEGELYTGLKPAWSATPLIRAADAAVAGGPAGELLAGVERAIRRGLVERLDETARARKHKDESVAAGRKYVQAYLRLLRYVETLEAAAAGVPDAVHGSGHR